MSKTLVLFDFDGTLTKRDTFNQFIFFSKGFSKGFAGYILFLPHILSFFLKLINGSVLKKKMTAYYFKNESEIVLKKKGEEFIEHLHNMKQLNEDLLKEMIRYKKSNATVCIVSASLDIWVKVFCGRYGIDYLCTEIEFKDAAFTGNFRTPNCNNEEKAIRIKQAYNLSDYSNIIAYGNSKGDKAMFALANEVHLIK